MKCQCQYVCSHTHTSTHSYDNNIDSFSSDFVELKMFREKFTTKMFHFTTCDEFNFIYSVGYNLIEYNLSTISHSVMKCVV